MKAVYLLFGISLVVSACAASNSESPFDELIPTSQDSVPAEILD